MGARKRNLQQRHQRARSNPCPCFFRRYRRIACSYSGLRQKWCPILSHYGTGYRNRSSSVLIITEAQPQIQYLAFMAFRLLRHCGVCSSHRLVCGCYKPNAWIRNPCLTSITRLHVSSWSNRSRYRLLSMTLQGNRMEGHRAGINRELFRKLSLVCGR